MLNKVDAFEKMLEKGKVESAVNKLQFDIRKHVEKWLLNYTVTDFTQLSKDQTISLIDDAISRLSVVV